MEFKKNGTEAKANRNDCFRCGMYVFGCVCVYVCVCERERVDELEYSKVYFSFIHTLCSAKSTLVCEVSIDNTNGLYADVRLSSIDKKFPVEFIYLFCGE